MIPHFESLGDRVINLKFLFKIISLNYTAVYSYYTLYVLIKKRADEDVHEKDKSRHPTFRVH